MKFRWQVTDAVGVRMTRSILFCYSLLLDNNQYRRVSHLTLPCECVHLCVCVRTCTCEGQSVPY